MKRFLILCKRQLIQPVFLLLCLLLPVSCLFVRKLEQGSSSPLCIGLYAEEPDALTDTCFSDLADGSRNLTFEVYSDRETMQNDVATAVLDCAYAFDKGFHTKLLEKDYKNSITCYVSPSTVIRDLSREVVFASLFRALGEDIAAAYAGKAGIFEDTQYRAAMQEIAELYHKYADGQEVFSLDYQYLDTFGKEPSDTAASAVAMPVRGLIAVLLFISGLTGGVTYLSDRERKLPVSAICSVSIPLLFMAASSCLTLWLTGEAGNRINELIALTLYLLLILLFVRLLLVIIKKPALLSASIPVFALGSLIFCPIFINLGAALPFFAVMEKLFLPYYYLLLC